MYIFPRSRDIEDLTEIYREAKPVLIPEFFELDVRCILQEEKLANSRVARTSRLRMIAGARRCQ